jgi:hypothetical protein
MAAMSPHTLKELILKTQARYEVIQHENWDAERHRYRTHDTAMWQQAAREVAPREWAEIVRVLAQGESYYDGRY